MQYFPYLFAAALAGIVLLWALWLPRLGLMRATLAAACRAGWILPVFLAFLPQTTTVQIPGTVALKPLHVFIDDSKSMQAEVAVVSDYQELLRTECMRLGCAVKTDLLSDLHPATKSGFSPLDEALSTWLYSFGNEPWLVFSDGGDWHPNLGWSTTLRGLGQPSSDDVSRGALLDLATPRNNNIWLTTVDVPPFSFRDQPVELHVGVGRSEAMKTRQRVQLQVALADKNIGSVNAEFGPEDREINVSLTVPALPNGQHLLQVQIVPLAGEEALWDNQRYAQIEVLPNTIGVLHLLGAPSWDGRFFRRFLKAEPKFDLISFFILRDPWDSQQVNERELSLIPFPTQRLFEEELPNFRVVVIQNFALFQFLEESYQRNLVDFVKNGGSMLFIGGPRALQAGDITSSALSEILPFVPPSDMPATAASLPSLFGNLQRPSENKAGPYFDDETAFDIELADPDPASRALANVIDDWEAMSSELRAVKNTRGLHHMEKVTFKDEESTPLLYANTAAGKRVPLAVASYPGKGRAIWLFTDSLWRVAMQKPADVPRQTYQKFLQSSLQWLTRAEIQKPLVAKDLRLIGGADGRIKWRLDLKGPSTKYLRRDVTWQFSLCGKSIGFSDFDIERTGQFEISLAGTLDMVLAGGQQCQFVAKGEHVAFGEVQTDITSVFPRRYSDDEVGGSRLKLEELSRLTSAELWHQTSGDAKQRLVTWLEKWTGSEGVGLPSQYKNIKEHYWPLDRWWIWLLLGLLPLEVMVRRWHHLVGR